MKRIAPALTWLIMLILPAFLLMTAVRLVINPLFAQVEYRTPNFPADTYGFTQQDRLKWSRYAIDYLLNDAGISYLGDLTFPDGSPLYNDRELSHMVDVKVLVQQMIAVWYIVTGVLLGLWAWAYWKKWLPEFWQGISLGGWLTIGLVFAILLMVAISFDALFTGFHRIFFQGNSWIFYYSDTLIRLFPIRFWRDAFILVGGFTLLSSLGLGILGRRLALRNPQE